MILSSRSIQDRIHEPDTSRRIVITDYSTESQQPASYDLRCADSVTLAPHAVTLVSSLEWVELPGDLAATLMCRSSLGRKGVLIGGGYVDPGFRGHLTLCLVHMGSQSVSFQSGERIVQMIFHEVTDGDHWYNGQYQDSVGAIEAR
ncbi:MAG: dCTP deaminase [Methanospirillaceae archaeon]|nr:dCTP deaminase [Methanospirillaceae archaeon]